jgi:hypothetical protein
VAAALDADGPQGQQRETPTAEEYCQPFPAYTDLIQAVFREEAAVRERRPVDEALSANRLPPSDAPDDTPAKRTRNTAPPPGEGSLVTTDRVCFDRAEPV